MSNVMVGGDVLGFSWNGTLGPTELRAIYSRCGSLRLSGLLELRDGGKRAEVVFIGGEPVETHGADSREVLLWGHGTFHVTQRVPDLSGSLTDGIRLDGDLREAGPAELIRHCQDARLTGDLEIDQQAAEQVVHYAPPSRGSTRRASGQRAEIRFVNGRVESVAIDGRPELAALARISGWVSGRFTIVLRPLFGDERSDRGDRMPGASAAGTRPADPAEGEPVFDLTAPVQLPEYQAPREPHPQLRPLSLGSVPAVRAHELVTTVPLGTELPSVIPPPPELPADTAGTERGQNGHAVPPSPNRSRRHSPGAAGLSLGASLAAEEDTEITRLPADRTAITRSAPLRDADRTDQTESPGRRSTIALLLAGGAVFAVVALGTALLWPRKPAPVWLPPPASRDPTLVPTRNPAQVAAGMAEQAANAPPGEKRPGTRPAAKPATAALPVERSVAEQKQIDAGRWFLVNGKAKRALKCFAAARALAPNDALVETLQRMAIGRTGDAMLFIDGKGVVIIDTQRLGGPRRMVLPAGPHTIGDAEHQEDLILRRGEKRHVKAGP